MINAVPPLLNSTMELDLPSQGLKPWISKLQPSQIVCLELDRTFLYAEVVQVVEARRLCWARPLVLFIDSSETVPSQLSELRSNDSPNWHDLRQGADLLLPTILFRQALDVEAIPVLSSLCGLEAIANSPPHDAKASHQVSEFIRQLCLSHPDAFSGR